jgi:hypothetical protein
MNLSGPAPISIVQQPDENGLYLRLSQRFSAEVLQVSGDRVVLSINGVQLVARMTTPDQTAQLLEHHSAQFIVRDLAHSTVTLQLVPKGAENATAGSSLLADLVPNLLQQAGLPVNETTVAIARALVSNNLAVTANLVEELENVIEQVDGWGQREAQQAAELKAAGLPVTAETIKLTGVKLPPLIDLLNDLYVNLHNLLRNQHQPATRDLIETALIILGKVVVDLRSGNSNPASQLRQAVHFLGVSIESELARLAKESYPINLIERADRGLSILMILRQALLHEGNKESTSLIDRFIEGLRLMQFLNVEPESKPIKEQWLRFDLPLAMADDEKFYKQKGIGDLHTARLKISFLPNESERKIDPHRTRFMIRVELDAKECVLVDVSIAEKRIGLEVTASSEQLLHQAEGELPRLEKGLERLGYIVQSSRCKHGDVLIGQEMEVISGWNTFNEVQAEV